MGAAPTAHINKYYIQGGFMALDLFNLTKQKVDPDISHYKFTITGNYGTGKSTFATELFNRFGRAVTFGFEDRFKGIDGITVARMKKWDEALKSLQQLRAGVKKNGLPFDTIIIDPVGIAGEMCQKYICKRESVDEIGDIPYGGGYSMLQTEFNQFEDSLKEIGFNVQHVAHGKTEVVKPPRASEYNIFTPDVPKKLIYKTQGEADFIVYLEVIRDIDEETGKAIVKRRLYLQNYADYQLKVPIPGLPDYIEYEEASEGVDKLLEAWEQAVGQTEDGDDNTVKENVPEEAETKSETTVGITDTYDSEALMKMAVEARDKNLVKNGGEYTPKAMKEKMVKMLGTFKIAECEDLKALKEFIDELEEDQSEN